MRAQQAVLLFMLMVGMFVAIGRRQIRVHRLTVAIVRRSRVHVAPHLSLYVSEVGGYVGVRAQVQVHFGRAVLITVVVMLCLVTVTVAAAAAARRILLLLLC